jgi:hypothetical protein
MIWFLGVVHSEFVCVLLEFVFNSILPVDIMLSANFIFAVVAWI